MAKALLLAMLISLTIATPALAQDGGENPIISLGEKALRVIVTIAVTLFVLGLAYSAGIEGQIEAHFGRPGALAALVIRVATGIVALLLGLFASAILGAILRAVQTQITFNIPTPW